MWLLWLLSQPSLPVCTTHSSSPLIIWANPRSFPEKVLNSLAHRIPESPSLVGWEGLLFRWKISSNKHLWKLHQSGSILHPATNLKWKWTNFNSYPNHRKMTWYLRERSLMYSKFNDFYQKGLSETNRPILLPLVQNVFS